MINEITKSLDLLVENNIANYNPLSIVNTVNKLIPLGKDKALDFIDHFQRERSLSVEFTISLFLVLRVLFEVPPFPGYHKPLLLGSSKPKPPSKLELLPHFPILIVEDIPLLMVRGYNLGGLPEEIGVHIRHFKNTGNIRTEPLRPKHLLTGDKKIIDSIIDQYIFRYVNAYDKKPTEYEIISVRNQLNRIPNT